MQRIRKNNRNKEKSESDKRRKDIKVAAKVRFGKKRKIFLKKESIKVFFQPKKTPGIQKTRVTIGTGYRMDEHNQTRAKT